MSNIQTTSDKLESILKESYRFIITTDDQKIYYETDTKNRIELSDIIKVNNLDELNTLNPLSNKLYLVLDNCTLYIYKDNSWNKIAGSTSVDVSPPTDNEINDFITDLWKE